MSILELKTMKVGRVVRETNRTLIYNESGRYRLIAKPEITVETGDIVQYRPEGENFGQYIGPVGWFVNPRDKINKRPWNTLTLAEIARQLADA